MTLHDERRATWERYASAWKAPTAEDKHALLKASTLDDCVYTDPLTRTTGHEALVAYMLNFHQQVPGGHFVTRAFQFHHACGIAQWDMVDGSGTKVGEGISYAQFDDAGQLRTMTGFFDAPDAPA